MKNINIGILAFAGIIALNSCASKVTTTQEPEATPLETVKSIVENGFAFTAFDKSVRPQDNFYDFVNGTWMKTAKIPSDKSTWGSFNKLAEDTDNNSMTILHSLLNDQFAPGSEGKKIQDLYATYMDMNKRNADGISPIKADLAKIDGIKSLTDLQTYLIEATKNGDSGSKLKVTFLPQGLRWLPVGKADYWVLALDPNYNHALVGTPNQKYLWILSRTPTMDEATYQTMVATAKSQGYDVSKLQKTVQNSR